MEKKKKQSLQQMVLAKLDSHLQKNEVEHILTQHKEQTQKDKLRTGRMHLPMR